MTEQAQTKKSTLSLPWASRLPFYYGWLNLCIASLAMLATLPGRSVGIGLITEPLIRDLSLSRLAFGEMNFWATLIGASFNLLCGPATDRFGVRQVATLVLAMLSLVVLAFSNVVSAGMLLLMLIAMRGFGQSALSVVSLTIVGKWFVRRLSIAMGIFSVVISIGFATAIVTTQYSVAADGWRSAWSTIGWAIAAIAFLAWLLVRRNPESVGLAPDTESKPASGRRVASASEPATGFGWKHALQTPAFWVFAIGSALYNMVIAGVLLFNQSILQQLGLDDTVFRNAMAVYMVMGLGGNLLAGWLARKWSLGKLMSVAMLLVAGYLLTFPLLYTTTQALVHASALGLSGGVVVVIFFTAWGKVFGRPNLGKIQGTAQVFTVFASASGPLLLASVFEATGSYNPAFYWLAAPILVVAVVGWVVRIPGVAEAGTA